MRLDSSGRNRATNSNGLRSCENDEPAEAVLKEAQFKIDGSLKATENSMAESAESEGQDHSDEEGYIDVDDDLEKVAVVSLFDDTLFEDVSSMLDYTKSSYGFDFASVQKRLGLNFLEMIKLVNFVRSEVKEGRGSLLDMSTKSAFDDDRYLQPVLEDDALLYSLEDISGAGDDQGQDLTASIPMSSGAEEGGAANLQIAELQQDLFRTQQAALATQQRLELAKKALGATRYVDTEKGYVALPKSNTCARRPKYEGNYDGPELHRTMIADKARTETYRNFILSNRHLFKDKVVLDVGCGTSILSLFCADAGAKVVYAVDQSMEIINKAREIVFRNGKQDIIKLIHGRIQDIMLPVQRVDVIVSEWMGYCLLYEAMFDSVIWARDRYLKENGLLIPAKSTLYVAPFCHPEYRLSKIDFWDDIYGYDMGCFKPDVLKDIDVDTSLDSNHLVGAGNPFIRLDHYKTTVADLSFRNKPFSFTINRNITEPLDGFALWFDVTLSAPEPSSSASSCLTLSTGPEDAPTHWRQGLFLIDRKDRKEGETLRKDLRIDGEISFEKEGEDKEGLDISIEWRSDAGERGKQEWLLR